MREYLYIDPLREFVNHHLEWYGVDSVLDDDRVLITQIEEDDRDFIAFVIDLHRGYFHSKDCISSYLRKCTLDRRYEDSKILKMRIYSYLDYKGILLV